MSTQREPASLHRPRLRLQSGWNLVDTWAAAADQVEKNAVHEALINVPDGAVFRTHPIIDDRDRPQEFFVLVRHDLVIKVRTPDLDSFDILYIGPPVGAAAEVLVRGD